MHGRIYICDDEVGMLRYLKKMLAGWGAEVKTFECPLTMLQALRGNGPAADLLLLDIRMAEMDGLETLRQVRSLLPELPVIMMTGHGSIESAVEAMKLGAQNYLTKPFPQEQLRAVIEQSLQRRKLLEENRNLKQKLNRESGQQEVVFKSALFAEIYDLAMRVTGVDSPLLILGESGCGKELVARDVHRHSPRSNAPFLAINCAALTEPLLESQLFGHVRGAFTGALQNRQGLLAAAEGGTLFLDEIGELSPALQAKLLRVLQQGEYLPVGSTRPRHADVRFMAATNRNLEEEVAAGRFREDLYYRLNVITLELPPLRRRPEDIPPLVEHFLAKVAERLGQPRKRADREFLTCLHRYGWPGNVRELENVIERSVVLARGDTLTPDLLPAKIRHAEVPPEAPFLESYTLRDAEKLQISRALDKTGWNKSRAAELLGITRKTLDKKIRDFQLAPEKPR
ncbi:two-component system response regulator HydG [Geothermobacter ehrlichii]|uniref:DNA-binding transcriptional regulator NtrC n=1 Tax=Geothermobacter ehrlichii TaxID=213224 RepID=A0A5D3WGU6_9BACT|nr:sigma-54 dependent transcriptional regulator [Geothermobacter ehrlichii]TYO95810.1 two-component system response regulator HydG [Geothermobacter ehrlichii]